jgi:hypothetical protein
MPRDASTTRRSSRSTRCSPKSRSRPAATPPIPQRSPSKRRRDERGEWLVQDATGLFDDTPLMREWNRIRIVAAFGSHEEEVLRGFIRQIRAEYPEDAGAAKLVVECQDESLQLDREHRRRSWGSEQSAQLRPADPRRDPGQLLRPHPRPDERQPARHASSASTRTAPTSPCCRHAPKRTATNSIFAAGWCTSARHASACRCRNRP